MAKVSKKRKLPNYVKTDEIKVGETYYYKIGNLFCPAEVKRLRVEVKYPSGLYSLVDMKELYKEVK